MGNVTYSGLKHVLVKNLKPGSFSLDKEDEGRVWQSTGFNGGTCVNTRGQIVSHYTSHHARANWVGLLALFTHYGNHENQTFLAKKWIFAHTSNFAALRRIGRTHTYRHTSKLRTKYSARGDHGDDITHQISHSHVTLNETWCYLLTRRRQ